MFNDCDQNNISLNAKADDCKGGNDIVKNKTNVKDKHFNDLNLEDNDLS